MKPFIRVGNRIINTAHIQRIEVQGPDLVNVYLIPDRMEQFEDEEAHAFLTALDDYVKYELTESEIAAERNAHPRQSFERIIGSIEENEGSADI